MACNCQYSYHTAMIKAEIEAVTPSILSSIFMEFIKPITQTSRKNDIDKLKIGNIDLYIEGY
jgi:hypothetical protein